MKKIDNFIRIIFLVLFLFLLIKGRIMLWLVLFGISLIFALFFGRIYCGYICPINTLMQPAEWLSKKINKSGKTVPKWLSKGYFAIILLILSLGSMLFAKKTLGINIPILPIWIVLGFLLTIIYRPHVFHNYICPFGVLQKLFGKFSRFSKRVDPDTCTGCKLCEKVCPAEAIKVSEKSKKAEINAALCHQCSNCTVKCPTNSIKYGKSTS